MGFDLSFSKAQDSLVDGPVVWTSGVLELLWGDEAIKITVKEEILLGLSSNIDDILKVSAVQVDNVRSLAGRATCVASLIYVWRPFVNML